MQKTSNDLELSLVEFQRAQKVSVERQRTVVQGVRMAVEDASECVTADTIINIVA